MSGYYQRRGPDGLQKLFLYLILIDWFLIVFLTPQMTTMPFRYGSVASVLMFFFNVLLVSLCSKRARRSGDGYLLYPVIFGALWSFIMVFYFHLFL